MIFNESDMHCLKQTEGVKDPKGLDTQNTKLQVELGTTPDLQIDHQVACGKELENASDFNETKKVEIQVQDEEKTQRPIT